MISEKNLQDLAPVAHGVLRIIVGYQFFLHGMSKLFGYPHDPSFDGLQLFSLMGVAGTLELLGGTLVMLGFCTRATAFVLSGLMAVAYFMAHATQGYPLMPIANHGEAAVLYCFIYLYFVFAGPGAWSIDNRLRAN